MNPTRTPLNLLRTFDSAGRHLSFKKAAEELCITPPAVSHQIKALEQKLGVALFVRNNRELAFTAAGSQYWQQVHASLSQLDQFTRELQRQHGQATLVASIMPPLASTLVIPHLAEFTEQYPGINLRIDSSIRNVNLEQGDADVAIRYGDGRWPPLVSRKLLDIYVQPVFPAAFASRYDFSDPADVRRLPLIHMSARPNAWQRWFAATGLGAPQPEKEYHLDDYPAALEAAKTLGGTLAAMPIEQYLVDSGVLIAPLPRLGPLDDGVFAVYRPADQDNPVIQGFVQWIESLLQRTFSD